MRSTQSGATIKALLSGIKDPHPSWKATLAQVEATKCDYNFNKMVEHLQGEANMIELAKKATANDDRKARAVQQTSGGGGGGGSGKNGKKGKRGATTTAMGAAERNVTTTVTPSTTSRATCSVRTSGVCCLWK
jgi:hypothetical protein